MLERTKVVLRRLPPSISHATLMEQIDGAFSGRYHWVSFRPGKTSQRNQTFSRAYIDFRRPEDVLEFSEFFNGHVFVNEKGTQFKTIVEYAPSQRVPNCYSVKDGREGTIFRDHEYLEFLEFLAKPVDNLPSAEIQLERREAEKTGGLEESHIVTPLMEFVRRNRVAKPGSGKSVLNKKAGGSSGRSPNLSSKRGSGKRKVPHMYVLRDSVGNTNGKDNPSYILIGKCDDKTDTLPSADGTDTLEEDGGVSGVADGRKKKVLLLRGKEKEIFHEAATCSVKNLRASTASRLTSLRGGSGRVVKSILLNKDVHQSQSPRYKSEQQMQAPNLEDKWPPQPSHTPLIPKDADGLVDNRAVGNKSYGFPGEKLEKRTRSRSEHGPHKSMGRRGPLKLVKESDGLSFVNEGKHGRRGSASGYGSQEKQWVQKASSGS